MMALFFFLHKPLVTFWSHANLLHTIHVEIYTVHSPASVLKMGHDHSHHHHHHHPAEHGSPKNIVIAFWLNTAFAIIEIAGGIFTNSMAILADAVHDLGDSLALGLAYYFQKKSTKAKDQTYTYGYQRFSLLGAFINSIILIVSSAFIIRESVTRLFSPLPPDAQGMVILAVIGLAVNGYALIRLRKGDSVNERVVALHFIEDVVGWLAVLIGSIVMMFVDVPVLDPILSLLIAAYILFNVFRNLQYTFRILLQRRPDSVDEEVIRRKVLAIPGVKDLHDLRFWSMDGQYNVMTLHVVVAQDQSIQQREMIKNEVKHHLAHLKFRHTTVEIESEEEDCNP